MGSNQTLRADTEKKSSDKHDVVAFEVGSYGNDGLEEGDHEYEDDKAFVDFEVVDEVANEEGAENVREGEDGVKHLELFFVDVEGLFNGLGESLWVVEGVVISETGEGDECQSDEVDSPFGDAELEGRLVRLYICHILCIKLLTLNC